MAEINVKIEGIEKLIEKFERLGKAIENSPAMVEGFLQAGRVVRNAVKSEAPLGETGKLKGAMAVYGIMNPNDRVGFPGGFVKAAPRGSATYAPHAHLVEMGTKERYTKSGAYRGRMPANPFFLRGVAMSRGAVTYGLTRALQDFIANASNV